MVKEGFLLLIEQMLLLGYFNERKQVFTIGKDKRVAQKNKFYVTTPIYYATAAPHLGTLYSTILADVAARWHKVQNISTHFLTGTDEYGQKVAQAAEAVGKQPKEFVDQFIGAYKDLWKNYDIEYSQFIRTTDEAHVKAVQQWIADLQKKGDIYNGKYEGWYCTPCETYLTEKNFEKDHKNPPCVSCGRETQLVSEECYFFKLSAYQDKLLKFYEENPNFITPKERAAEVVSFVKGGLQDLSISRTTISWGVPFPGDEKHVTYVWADALNNYITAIGYGQKNKEADFKKWWPADMQVIGKDIVRFHAIYWPAFLMASGLPMPQKLLVHGWIKMGEHKMSKSLGNSINPNDLLEDYGSDCVRYYLTRQIAITHDGQFSRADLEQKISSDLANDLGNLLQRMVTLADKNGVSTIEPSDWDKGGKALQEASIDMIVTFQKEMDRGFYHLALNSVWKFLNQTNSYFHNKEPWKLAKSNNDAFLSVLSATCHSLLSAGVLLWPVMPNKMEELFSRLGYTFTLDTNHVEYIQKPWSNIFTIKKGDTLFKKPEPKEEVQEEQKKTEEFIKIDDFIKVDLRVGTITECVEVDGSDKLLRLSVDMGDLGTRTIFAGVKKFYTAEELVGKQGVFVANLKPRKMMGSVSEGMMLCAEDADGNVIMITPQKDALNGVRLK